MAPPGVASARVNFHSSVPASALSATTFGPAAPGGIRRVEGFVACPSGRLTYSGWTDVFAAIYGDPLRASATRRVGPGTYRYTLVQHVTPDTYDDEEPAKTPGFVLALRGRHFSTESLPRVFFGRAEGSAVTVASDAAVRRPAPAACAARLSA